ncbi:MAG: hypothetical protein D3906_17920 [Candidatus Electrothrix sp. AUS1_2]|nr:hypothetical protein [Candidatus Electrothrix sp. AUS1_2]
MEDSDILFDDILTFLRKNYRIMAGAGTVVGAVLVIFYGSKINHYPSGMTISDTLFFLWVLAIAGFIYSVVFFVFFRASLLWIILCQKPINWIFKKILKVDELRAPAIKDKRCILADGTFFNLFILLHLIFARSLPLALRTLGVFFLIIFGYTCLTALLKRSEHKIIIPGKKEDISQQKISPSTGRLYFLFLIYFSPLLVGNSYLIYGITQETFQMMGVRITGADIAVEKKIFEDGFNQLKSNYFAKDSVKCSGDTCLLQDTTILFTGIGDNTKLEVNGSAGSAEIIIPNSAIQFIIKRKPNTP